MAPELADTEVPRYYMTWEEVYERGSKHIPQEGKPYGIPRGGSIVAAMCKELPVEDPAEADFFVDDIIDTGDTKKSFAMAHGPKPFYALVDKQNREEDKELPWIVFPWEMGTDEETGPTDAVVRLLEHIGEDPQRDGLQGTPVRVVKALDEMCSGYYEDPRTILGTSFEVETDEMVILKGVRFASLCEHHMLPFSGTVSIGYLPGKRVVGISKLARVTQTFAKRLQIQERLTIEIAHAIDIVLKPTGVGVVVTAHHQCMGCRGVRQPDAEMVTSCMLGAFRHKPEARAELLGLIG